MGYRFSLHQETEACLVDTLKIALHSFQRSLVRMTIQQKYADRSVLGGCPYITIVGSTNGINEVASNFTSGGFSNLFARPSFQGTAVTGYLNNLGSTNAGLFNTSGRAFPDVAAQGKNVEIIVGGISGLIGGTSCSSPIFSSVISLVNDRLIAAGKPVLGFLNPLYVVSVCSGNVLNSPYLVFIRILKHSLTSPVATIQVAGLMGSLRRQAVSFTSFFDTYLEAEIYF